MFIFSFLWSHFRLQHSEISPPWISELNPRYNINDSEAVERDLNSKSWIELCCSWNFQVYRCFWWHSWSAILLPLHVMCPKYLAVLVSVPNVLHTFVLLSLFGYFSIECDLTQLFVLCCISCFFFLHPIELCTSMLASIDFLMKFIGNQWSHNNTYRDNIKHNAISHLSVIIPVNMRPNWQQRGRKKNTIISNSNNDL